MNRLISINIMNNDTATKEGTIERYLDNVNR